MEAYPSKDAVFPIPFQSARWAMRRIGWITVLGVAATTAATACGGGNSNPPGPTPTQIAKVGGDSQIGAAGATLGAPLSLVVKDASGSPLAHATILSARSGGRWSHA